MRAEADRLWDIATQLSNDAGFPYKGRDGYWVYPTGAEPPMLSSDAIELYKQRVRDAYVMPPQTPLQ